MTLGPPFVLHALDTPLAKQLAEGLLAQQDMRSSIAVMTLWHKKYAGRELADEEFLIGPSLFRDAIVQFVGCFQPNKIFCLSADEIYGQHEGGSASFAWFKDTRDAFAAHRFGAQRQCFVGAAVDPTTKQKAVGNLCMIYAGPDKADGPQLIGFMRTAANHLDAKVANLMAQVTAEVEAMTPEQIEALPPARAYGVDPGEVRLTRKELQRARSNTDPSSTQSC